MPNFYKTFARIACNLFVPFCLSTSAFAATYSVTTTAATGAGSLADAIALANANPGADVIVFNIASGPFIISPTSTYTITGPLTLDGYSQTGASAGTIAGRTILIQIDGGSLPGGTDLFSIQSPDVSISGLAITRATKYGINVQQGANNAHIWGNYFGTDAAGNAGSPVSWGNANAAIAVNIFAAVNGATTTGVVVGIKDDNVNDLLEGNLIAASTGNGGGGEGDGIIFWNTRNSVIAGNIIGLGKNGTEAGYGNARNGILLTVTANNNIIGTNANGEVDASEGNIIGNNGAAGILNFVSHSNIYTGNKIGINAANAAAPNGAQGIDLMNSQNCRIGTDGTGGNYTDEANLICFNNSDGIRLITFNLLGLGAGYANNTDGNVIAGNGIGTDLAGTLIAANLGSGVLLTAEFSPFTVSGNIIGSNNDGSEDAFEGNRIANNNQGGVVMKTAGGIAVLNNKVSRNRIFNNNSLLGIDIDGDNVTTNDDGDGDAGVNNMLNFPVITSVEVNGANLIVRGFSRPNSVIEFYVADAGPNPNPPGPGFTRDFGEGMTYLFRGQDDATIDAPDTETGTSGTYTAAEEGTNAGGTRTESRFAFSIPLSALPATINAGTRITALAYENVTGAGNTSEFGPVNSTVVTPVRMLNLDANYNNGKVVINWKTAEEIDNHHFELLKSLNGTQFSSIGTIAAKGSNSSYQYIDNNVTEKLNYYKLKQVDIDGRATESKILVVRTDLGAVSAKLSPNPFRSYLNLSYNLTRSENLSVRIFHISGSLVRSYNIKGNAGVNTTSLSDLGYLPAGNYTVEITGNNFSFRQQVVKQ